MGSCLSYREFALSVFAGGIADKNAPNHHAPFVLVRIICCCTITLLAIGIRSHLFLQSETLQSNVDAIPVTAMSGEPNLSRSFLPVVNVTLKKNGREFVSKAVLNSGSELNIITSKCCERLNLKDKPIDINIVGAGGVTSRTRTKMVHFFVKDASGNEIYVECIVLNKACGRALPIDSGCIPRRKVCQRGEIDFLVGMSSPELHKQYTMEKLPNGLYLMRTRFGTCLVGLTPRSCSGNYKCGVYNVNHSYFRKLRMWCVQCE